MAVPLGVLGGIYLNEYGGTSKFASLVRFLSEILTGVPSIVMGLFIYTVWVLPRKGAGLTAFAGSLALGALMLPVIIRTSEEMLKLVPRELREGSLALGSRKSRTIRTVVLPARGTGDRERRAPRRGPGRRRDRARCCSPSAPPRARTGTSSRDRTTR